MMSVTTRVRGLAPWSPQKKTRVFLDVIRSVLEEYVEHLPLTIRQIFYRLVGIHDYDKTEKAYDRLCETLNRARRSGEIPFSAIRDDGTTLAEPLAWEDANELIQTFIAHAAQFRLDRQLGQRTRLIFAVEATGMLPQVERLAEPYGIAVHSSGGFDSLTAKYELAENLGQRPAVEVLHIGDCDPSGEHLFSSMAEDVCAIAHDLSLPGVIQFTRLAVTRKQIAVLGLPTAPAKKTDKRSFEGETVQCEAIPPDVLAQIITSAIEQRINRSAYDAVLRQEQDIRRVLAPRLEALL